MPEMNQSETAIQTDPFAEEELASVIEWLRLEEGEEWQAAARSLYVRYHEWLFRRLYAPLKDRERIKEVVLQTFGKAVRCVSKFSEKTEEDPDDTRARFEAWMLKIARRLECDYLRKVDPTETTESEFWDSVNMDMQQPSQAAPSSPEVDAVREFMSECSEREQIIIRAWLLHSPDITNQQSKLPRDVLQELSDSLGTTKVNIRKIKSRALARFKEKLGEKGIK